MDRKRPEVTILSKPDSSDEHFEPLKARGKNARGIRVYAGCPTFPSETEIRQRLRFGFTICAIGLIPCSYSFTGGNNALADSGGIIGTGCVIRSTYELYM